MWYFLISYHIVYIGVAVFLFVLGVVLSNELTIQWGKDPRQIVIDEYASLLVPLYFTPRRIIPVIITFALFRFFDIVKPFPLRRLEEVPGGWGIMLDDLGAALYTTVIVLIITATGIRF
jgi:phosphatidylglycerophosphatase A